MNEQEFGKIDSVVDESIEVKLKEIYIPEMEDNTIFKEPVTAQDFLTKAKDLMDERGGQYDSEEGERSAGKIATAFNSITGHNISASDAWMFLLILKLVRQSTTDTLHKDSAEDAVAYCALMAEQLMKDGH